MIERPGYRNLSFEQGSVRASMRSLYGLELLLLPKTPENLRSTRNLQTAAPKRVISHLYTHFNPNCPKTLVQITFPTK